MIIASEASKIKGKIIEKKEEEMQKEISSAIDFLDEEIKNYAKEGYSHCIYTQTNYTILNAVKNTLIANGYKVSKNKPCEIIIEW